MESIIASLLAELLKHIIQEKTPRKADRNYTLLCVEIGHIRCKVNTIEIEAGNYTTPRLKSLQTTQPLPSAPFLDEGGFSKFIELLIVEQSKGALKIDGLGLSICCPVNSENGTINSDYLPGWPQELRQVLHHETGHDDIVIVNDAASFAFGYGVTSPVANKLRTPILAITLGGGVGGAIIQRKKPLIVPYEMGGIWKIWKNGFEGNPHMLAGQAFFDWADNETNWDQTEKNLNFSQRLAWIINSVREQRVQFNSVLIGGGRAVNVDQVEMLKHIEGSYKCQLSRKSEVALYGAAHLWLSHFHYEIPFSELVYSN